ncbi:MAG TPA: NAD(P)-dependent oxidoreductase [bacterium]|nr:NAD(P)-dependent oxidoreductase [bacterium]
MKVLLTGAFGNVGKSTIHELVKQGHEVRCFDIRSKVNEKAAAKYKGRIEVMWGDIRRFEDVANAMRDREAVVHLAFMIPSTMSHTGKSSEDHPDLAEAVNVGGTANIIEAARSLLHRPRLIFSSSISVYGITQDQSAPRTASDPIYASDHYSEHKLVCEKMVMESGLDWVILRFAAVLAVNVGMNPDMFDTPLDNRIEFVHSKDVGLACANAVSSADAAGKVLLIGGGPSCQMKYGDMISGAMEVFGLGMLPEEAFCAEYRYFDWLDTDESQRILNFQRHSYKDWLNDVKRHFTVTRHLARMFKPISRWVVLQKSPYYQKA